MRKLLNKGKSGFFTLICQMQTGVNHVANCKINGYTRFNGREKFGSNINFNGCRIYGNGRVVFGDNFHSASGLKILTTFHNYNGTRIPYDRTVVTKDVVIEDNVWIGMDVKIMGGVTIGEGVIIQAGSVVVSDVPKYSIAGGSPAKVFKTRDIQHYEALKEEGLFF